MLGCVPRVWHPGTALLHPLRWPVHHVIRGHGACSTGREARGTAFTRLRGFPFKTWCVSEHERPGQKTQPCSQRGGHVEAAWRTQAPCSLQGVWLECGGAGALAEEDSVSKHLCRGRKCPVAGGPLTRVTETVTRAARAWPPASRSLVPLTHRERPAACLEWPPSSQLLPGVHPQILLLSNLNAALAFFKL